MVLKVRDLSFARGGVRIVDGLSFDLSAGSAILLRGPNGIGKTTALRTIAGLQPPLAGQIEAPADSMTYAGHLDGVKPTLTVLENLRFWASVFGHGDVDRALDAFDLRDLQDRFAGQLSAGQKRRLGLARLLVTGRTTWLLDEPTVSLDVDARQVFEAVVNDHLVAGGAALIATHIDFKVSKGDTLDLSNFKATSSAVDAFDEAFL